MLFKILLYTLVPFLQKIKLYRRDTLEQHKLIVYLKKQQTIFRKRHKFKKMQKSTLSVANLYLILDKLPKKPRRTKFRLLRFQKRGR